MLRSSVAKTPAGDKQGRWRPSSRSEGNKLLTSLNVNVPANLSRTRAGSAGGKRTSTSQLAEETPVKSRRLFVPRVASAKPGPSAPLRGLFELDKLQNLICENFRCPECDSQVEVAFKSVCVASTCSVSCSSCSFSSSSGPLASTKGLDTKGTMHIRSTDFAANVLYVLSFLGSGDGGKEAARLLGFLDLPNAASMEKYSFPCIQRRMSSVLEVLCDEACMEALVEEVRVTMESQPEVYEPGDFNRWLAAVDPPSDLIDTLTSQISNVSNFTKIK